jgi:putative tryptophan/tyrosine transport system substrate-binding protein
VNRRRFLLTSLAGALAGPHAAGAQQPRHVPRIGVVSGSTKLSDMQGPNPASRPWRVFVHAMQDLGYVDGQTIMMDRRSAEGNLERLSGIFDELLKLKPNVLITAANPVAHAARQATSTIPIVMGSSSDPVADGLVANLARPGANITGFSGDVGWDINGKRLEMLKEALPGLSRMAVLYQSSPTGQRQLKDVEAAARRLRLTPRGVGVRGFEQMGEAFSTISRERPEALFVSDAALFFAHSSVIAQFAADSRLPSIGHSREYAEAGGLISYGADLDDRWRRVAQYVDRILKGAKPAELPIEQPTKFELVINLKTAKALGLTIPPSLLARADQVIE